MSPGPPYAAAVVNRELPSESKPTKAVVFSPIGKV